jgi:hypothetical protein
MRTEPGRLDEINDQDDASGQLGPDSGGQSGDTQGLSPIAEASDESVEELTDEGQDVEAEIVQGIEDAGDHPEQPVPDHRDRR